MVKNHGYSEFQARNVLFIRTEPARYGSHPHQIAGILINRRLIDFAPTRALIEGVLAERDASGAKLAVTHAAAEPPPSAPVSAQAPTLDEACKQGGRDYAG